MVLVVVVVVKIRKFCCADLLRVAAGSRYWHDVMYSLAIVS